MVLVCKKQMWFGPAFISSLESSSMPQSISSFAQHGTPTPTQCLLTQGHKSRGWILTPILHCSSTISPNFEKCVQFIPNFSQITFPFSTFIEKRKASQNNGNFESVHFHVNKRSEVHTVKLR